MVVSDSAWSEVGNAISSGSRAVSLPPVRFGAVGASWIGRKLALLDELLGVQPEPLDV